MASEQIIHKILAALWIRYPQTNGMDNQTRALTIAAWVEDLGDDCVNDDALYAAYVEYKNSPEKWMPSPGMLRTRAIELVQGNVNDLAERAWQGVIDCDYGREPRYLIDAVLSREIMRRLGGFDKMGETPSEWINKNFREPFLRMYAELKQRENASVPMLEGGAQKLLGDAANRLRVNKSAPINYEERREQLLRQAKAMK